MTDADRYEKTVLKPLSPLAASIEAASTEDVVLLMIALARAERAAAPVSHIEPGNAELYTDRDAG